MRRARQPKSTDILQFDGKNCSRCYVHLLTLARHDGVRFHLNSGFRSYAEQMKLYLLFKAGRGPLAAFPGTSTHNKKGWKQGLDIQNASALKSWAHSKGIILNLTVPGESWHLNAARDYNHRIWVLWQDYQAKQRHHTHAQRKRRASH